TAAALALYRLEHGEYPDTLSALVPDMLPAVPEDLFTTQPLLYRRTDDGYLLYSAGLNGIDDGGSHQGWKVYQGYRINSSEDEQAARKLLGLTPLPEPPENPDLFAEVTPPANPADVPLAEQIPAGADDISLRIPLLRPAVPLRPSP